MAMEKRQALELVYDDAEVGHPDLGFMPRDERIFTGAGGYDADDEDKAYERFLAEKGIVARVLDGKVFLKKVKDPGVVGS